MNDKVNEIVQIIEKNFLPSKNGKLILLCDDELYFTKCLSKYRAKNNNKDEHTTHSEQTGTGMRRHLYAFYAGDCTELLIDSPKKTLSQYILAKSNQHDKKLVKETHSILEYNIENVSFIEIGKVINKLLKGDARIIEILLGDRYLYQEKNETNEGNLPGKNEGGTLEVLYESPEWLRLRNNLKTRSALNDLRGTNCFFKSLLGQAYGLLKNVKNSQFSKIPDRLYIDITNFIKYLITHICDMVKSKYMLADLIEENKEINNTASREDELSSMLNEVEFYNSHYKKTILKSKDPKIKSIPSKLPSGTRKVCHKWKDKLRYATCAKWFAMENGKPNIFNSCAADVAKLSDHENNDSEVNTTAGNSINAALKRLYLHGNVHSQLVGEGTELTFMIRCGSFLTTWIQKEAMKIILFVLLLQRIHCSVRTHLHHNLKGMWRNQWVRIKQVTSNTPGKRYGFFCRNWRKETLEISNYFLHRHPEESTFRPFGQNLECFAKISLQNVAYFNILDL